MMKRILYFMLFFAPLCAFAQEEYPSVDQPQAVYTKANGEETDDASAGQSAPLVAKFTASGVNAGDWTLSSDTYEWKIFRAGEESRPLVRRSGMNMSELEYTFNESGTFYVQLYLTFIYYNDVLGNDTIRYPDDFQDATPIVVNISESKLEFPNAFSPNGDEFNNVLKAKEDHQSIVSFQAAVFSRWGQKIYSWTDINGGWDGRWNGHLVKDGVYFLVVNARGADGRKYNIRKAINVITGFNKDSRGTTSGEE